MQVGQNFGEKLMRWKGTPQQVLRESIYCQGLAIWNWRHKGLKLGVPSGDEETHMRRAPKVEQVPRDLWVVRPLHGEGQVLAGQQVGNDIHLSQNVDRLNGDLQIDDHLENDFGLLPEGKGACLPSLFM